MPEEDKIKTPWVPLFFFTAYIVAVVLVLAFGLHTAPNPNEKDGGGEEFFRWVSNPATMGMNTGMYVTKAFLVCRDYVVTMNVVGAMLMDVAGMVRDYALLPTIYGVGSLLGATIYPLYYVLSVCLMTPVFLMVATLNSNCVVTENWKMHCDGSQNNTLRWME